MLLAERPARLRGVGAVVLLAVAIGVALSTAPAAGAASKRVTFAARRLRLRIRQIFANEARNNLMESLQQLGPSTPYSSTSQMDPLVEARPPQDACRPLVGWRFTLGTGIAGTKLDGVSGSLSQVSNAYDTVISTAAETPILGPTGAPSGGSLKGAVTIDLTRDQENKAGSSNLWVMGGTSAAPVGDPTKYAFGALRCAVDNLNGDNVEFVSYPAQVEHVYCFAYYVSPPKGSGKIIVKKHITGLPAGTPAQTVDFLGNISFANYDPVGHPDDGTFALTSSAHRRRHGDVRPGGRDDVELQGDPDLEPDARGDCTAAGGPNGQARSAIPDPNPARPNGVDRRPRRRGRRDVHVHEHVHAAASGSSCARSPAAAPAASDPRQRLRPVHAHDDAGGHSGAADARRGAGIHAHDHGDACRTATAARGPPNRRRAAAPPCLTRQRHIAARRSP